MPNPSLTRAGFGALPDGRPVERWTLDSGGGVRADVLTYGGVLHALWVPDTAGRSASVVLGQDSVADYARSPYFGSLVGRYANRVAHGRFTLDGQEYQVPVNDRGHALHGGPDGFHTRLWEAAPADVPDGVGLALALHSPHGDMGFPGALDVTVTYALDRAGTLRIDYAATTDRPTVVNLTNHAYFNLAGEGSGDVLGHTLALDADRYLPVSAEAIPLGDPVGVADTAFDFSVPRAMGEQIGRDDPQVRAAGGYDHCWVLSPRPAHSGPARAARLEDPLSGRRLEVWTTEPGIQVYTGNTLDGSFTGRDAKPYERHGAVCLETQHLPDSPNRPGYPSTVLRPGAAYRSTTELRFPHLPQAATPRA
ncbi:galactose-1-epimerase [Streptomyces sp. DW26H14]|uniref:galactose-1-epimerase n=1 Tax=Streptomyces sp. DW26H14 TaxID=3435395 RepID=UPI00403D731C